MKKIVRVKKIFCFLFPVPAATLLTDSKARLKVIYLMLLCAILWRYHSMFLVVSFWQILQQLIFVVIPCFQSQGIRAKLQNLFVVSISDNKLYHFNHNIHHRGNPYKRMLQISIAIKSVALISKNSING